MDAIKRQADAMNQLLELLACPVCRDSSKLRIQAVTPALARDWAQALHESASASAEIECGGCGRTFPVTSDGIPVMWSDTLRDTFGSLDHAIDASNPCERDVKAANIHVYETIVDEYDHVGVHADPATHQRFLNALERAGGCGGGWHLDVGCGGGNILEMARKAGAERGIGVDVSLAALRCIRKKGFQAVLGDAESLPIRSSVTGLVTASSVLHHLYDPQRLIAEAQRTLKPGGLFLTDFDPNQEAAEWSRLAKLLYDARKPAYLVLSKLCRQKVAHTSRQVQEWNNVAEFHNHPGAGFCPVKLSAQLSGAGLEVLLLHKHNTRESEVTESPFIRPHLRAVVSQLLSFRNPWLRKNADTLMTLSRKPFVETRAPHCLSGQLSRDEVPAL